MPEYCNICGRELLKEVMVVDTSLDMRPVLFSEVQGDKSDVICIDCAIEAVENPPIVCSRCGQPIEFNEKIYVFKPAVAKPAGHQLRVNESVDGEECVCRTCFEDIMGSENEEEDVSASEKPANLRVILA